MAEITAAEQLRYRRALAGIQSDARKYVLSRLSAETRGLGVADARQAAILILGDSVSVFGDRAQAVSADLFDRVCEAEGIDASAEMFDDVIDTGMLEDKVRYYAGMLDGGQRDQVSFERMVSQLGGYYARRSAYANTLKNCEKNEVRYARVPGGGETCDFCMMLAGRGFDYHSEKSALGRGGHGVHQNCDCVVFPGRKGRTAIDGYDPEVCADLADKFKEIDSAEGLTGKQKSAVKAAWSMAKIGEDTAGLKSNPKDLDAIFDAALEECGKAFRKEKTEDNYDATVNQFLHWVGEAFGIDMGGNTYVKRNGREIVGACPNGEELWAALRWSQQYGASSVYWVPETTEHRMPDMIADGVGYEIKTPQSLRKISKLATDAVKKEFDNCGADDSSKNAIFSLLQIGDSAESDVSKVLTRFVADGSLDSASVLQT